MQAHPVFGVVCCASLLAAVAIAQLPSPPGFPGPKSEPPDVSKLAAAAGPLAAVARQMGGDPNQVTADLLAAVRGVSLYPERTRTAILNLAKHSNAYPQLLAELKAVRARPAAEIDRYLTSHGFPDELQQSAAIVLIDAPETIDRMLEKQPLAALVGKAYEIPAGKEAIDTLLAVLHEQTAQTQAASTDAWAEQLSANPQLLDQYLQMLADYAQQAQSSNGTETGTGETGAGSAGSDTGSYDPYGYGTTASSEGYSVSDVPSEEVINYALAYGYQYGEVAAALVNQYATQDNLDDFQQAVGHWWDNYGQSIPQDAYAAHQSYYDSLKELSQFDKAAAAQGATTAAERTEFLRRNSEQFSQVSRLARRGAERGPGGKGPFSQEAGSKGPLSKDVGKTPANGPFSKALSKAGPDKGPAGAGQKGAGAPLTKGSASPFSDLSKATPRTQRPPQSPLGGGNPFSALAKPGGKGAAGAPQTPFSALAGGKAPPRQVQRGMPSFGNQLGRAQSFHSAAWNGPRMGGGMPGMPRVGGGIPKGPGGGGFGPKGGGIPGKK